MNTQTCKWGNARKQHHQACASIHAMYGDHYYTVAQLILHCHCPVTKQAWALKISASIILSLSRNFVSSQQEKPVGQIQLTKTVVLVNTTELDGKSCSCAACIRNKLHCDTVGTTNKNWRWRLTTTELSWWARSQGEPHNHLQTIKQQSQ